MDDVSKKGAKLKRLLQEVHVARVEYNDVVTRYQKHSPADAEFSRVIADDIEKDKTAKKAKTAERRVAKEAK